MPAASIWAIPEDVAHDDPQVRAKLKELAAKKAEYEALMAKVPQA